MKKRSENFARRLREIDELPSLRNARDWQRELWENEVVLWSAIVRTARAVLLLSQSEFATAVEISRRTVISIESMERRATGNIQHKIVKYLEARGFHIDVDRDAGKISFQVEYDELRRCVDTAELEKRFEAGRAAILTTERDN
jgi:DNA-binding XRE family transcriptional regulator